MAFALIENDIVKEIWSDRPELHPDLNIVDVPEGTRQGAARQPDGSFAQPVYPSPVDAKRRNKLAAVNGRREAIIADGYQHNFGGSVGIRTLDQRGTEDAINWLGLKGIADSAIAAGQGSIMIAIRDANDETFEASANVVYGAMVAMGQWRGAVMAHAWGLKDAIAAAEDQAALDAIDIDAGWPE